jgi:hypothetical protein
MFAFLFWRREQGTGGLFIITMIVHILPGAGRHGMKQRRRLIVALVGSFFSVLIAALWSEHRVRWRQGRPR